MSLKLENSEFKTWKLTSCMPSYSFPMILSFKSLHHFRKPAQSVASKTLWRTAVLELFSLLIVSLMWHLAHWPTSASSQRLSAAHTPVWSAAKGPAALHTPPGRPWHGRVRLSEPASESGSLGWFSHHSLLSHWTSYLHSHQQLAPSLPQSCTAEITGSTASTHPASGAQHLESNRELTAKIRG